MANSPAYPYLSGQVSAISPKGSNTQKAIGAAVNKIDEIIAPQYDEVSKAFKTAFDLNTDQQVWEKLYYYALQPYSLDSYENVIKSVFSLAENKATGKTEAERDVAWKVEGKQGVGRTGTRLTGGRGVAGQPVTQASKLKQYLGE